MAIQIIEENRKPTFSEKLNMGMNAAARELKQYQANKLRSSQMQQENEAAKRAGIDLSGIHEPKMRQEAFQYGLKRKGEMEDMRTQFQNELEMQKEKYNLEKELQSQKLQRDETVENQKNAEKKNEKFAPLKAGLNTLEAMRHILNKKNLGLTSSVRGVFSSETRKDRAKYAQLGKSLISLASNIPIRNKAEFEVLAHDLYDPNNTDEKNSGILDAMEQIIHQNMQQLQGDEEINLSPAMNMPQQNRPPLTAFIR